VQRRVLRLQEEARYQASLGRSDVPAKPGL